MMQNQSGTTEKPPDEVAWWCKLMARGIGVIGGIGNQQVQAFLKRKHPFFTILGPYILGLFFLQIGAQKFKDLGPRYLKVFSVSQNQLYLFCYGPRSAVGNVSGNRCESDCKSRVHKFDPSPVPYFRGD